MRRSKLLPFLAWDGEGYTVREPSGMSTLSAWHAAIRARTDELLATGDYATRERARWVAHKALLPSRPDPGEHRYYLLANSDGATLRDEEGLGTRAIFDTLLANAQERERLHVVYGGSYDANKWLRDLDKDQLEAVYCGGTTPVKVVVGKRRYALQWRARKSLFIGRFVSGAPPFLEGKDGKRRANYDARVTIWDVLGFFQGTFVSTLVKYFPEGVRDLDEIIAMKAARSSFSIEEDARIESYCLRECELLRALMDRLREAMIEARIVPTRWDGAGACAAALLKRENVKDAIAEPPAAMALPIRVAYAGGRKELVRLGVTPKTYAHDIASAYPWATAALPSLDAPWEHTGADAPMVGTVLARVRFSFPDAPWYPLFYRTARKAILFPAQGEGWYYGPEVRAAFAFAHAIGGRVEVRDSWTLRDTGVRPFAFLDDLFTQRAEWKRAKNGAEKVGKLAMNSCYGKLAQQVGATAERLPPYFSLAYAGMITSATRARLVEAALTNPNAVIAFATDGIFTTSALATPDYGKDLGAWENDTIPARGVFAQAGVYWLQGPDALWHAKYRGFDAAGMQTPDAILAAWKRRERRISVSCTRFITAGSALASKDLWPSWGTWRTFPRALDLSGMSAKRLPNMRGRPDLRSCLLAPAHNLDYDLEARLSTPYPLLWENDRPALTDGVPDRLVEDEVTESQL